MVSKSRSNGYRFVDGVISSVVVTSQVVKFRLDERRVVVEKTPVTSALQDGDRIRVLLQAPLADKLFYVIAFQSTTDGKIHYTGPTLTLYVTVLGAALLATGIYSGLVLPLVSATSMFVLEWIVSAQKVQALREFDAAGGSIRHA
jgi:hypothetical protein